MVRKADWPALLPEGGMAHVSRDMLLALAVAPFAHRARREELTAKLFLWADTISALGVPLTLWIDGSYCTTKDEPNDIDLCVLASRVDTDALSLPTRERFMALIRRPYVKATYGLDLFMVEAADLQEQGEWKELFGKGHDRVTVKGIFVMKVQP